MLEHLVGASVGLFGLGAGHGTSSTCRARALRGRTCTRACCERVANPRVWRCGSCVVAVYNVCASFDSLERGDGHQTMYKGHHLRRVRPILQLTHPPAEVENMRFRLMSGANSTLHHHQILLAQSLEQPSSTKHITLATSGARDWHASGTASARALMIDRIRPGGSRVVESKVSSRSIFHGRDEARAGARQQCHECCMHRCADASLTCASDGTVM